MSASLVGWLVVTLALSGPPPALPPLPGERPAPAPAPEKPAEPPSSGPAPQEPAPPPAAPPPTTPSPGIAPPVEAAPAPTPAPSAQPPDVRAPPPPQAVPSPGESAAFGPELVEPPQPEPTAEPLPPVQEEGEVSTKAPRADGLADEDQEKPIVMSRPPPERPPHSGVGMFVTAGVLFAIAVVEQSMAQFLVQRECVEPLVDNPITPEDLDQAAFTCTPGVLPALILQAHAGLNVLAAIGMTAGGAALRAERDAWDDVFQTERVRPHARYRGAGIGLAAGGVVTWLASSAATWALLARCDGGNCVRRNRIAGFVARDIGFAMAAAGVGMLTYGEVYRRRRESNDRDRQTVVMPTAYRGGAGLALSGRF